MKVEFGIGSIRKEKRGPWTRMVRDNGPLARDSELAEISVH